MLRSILVLCVAVACSSCIYGKKGPPGTNLPPPDQGGPWSQGESGSPAFTGDPPQR